MLPFSVESKAHSVSLYQLKDGRFQMIKQGKLTPFMSGYDYILVENKLADFLESLNIFEIEFKNAIVWNRGTNEEITNYKQLTFKKSLRQYLTEENINNLDLKGLKVYLFGLNYLFVSPELKVLLEKNDFDYLLFGEGFTRFAF